MWSGATEAMSRSANKILFILLDAFRHDYINPVDTPFLYAGTQLGVYARKLKTTTGFTQRTSIFTGTMGTKSDMFTMFTFDYDGSPFRFLDHDRRAKAFVTTGRLLEGIPAVNGLRRLKRLLSKGYDQKEQAYRKWIQNESKKYAAHAPAAYIPLTLLPFIGVSEDNRPIHLPGAGAEETIFDVFVKEQIEYKYLMFPALNCEDEAVLQQFLCAKNSSAEIILGQFSDSDLLIHHCGPSSQRRRTIAGEIDRRLREIAVEYENDVAWIIIGDHGMTDVKEEIDIIGQLTSLEDKSGVTRQSDYLVFLDSTMARFRWITEKGREFLNKIQDAPLFHDKGRFIDEAMADRYQIPIADRRYGDLIWWANLGTLIFPDYFHDRYTHNKGMHGYDSDHDDMKGFFLAFGPTISTAVTEEAHLIDVCASLCAMVGVKPPKSNQGKSLLPL